MDYLAITVGGRTVQPPPGIPSCGLASCGEQLIQATLNLLFIGGFVLAIFMIVWGGIQWITSEGDAKRIDSARKRIVFAVIGLVVILSAFLIIQVVGGFFGFEGGNNIIKATK